MSLEIYPITKAEKTMPKGDESSKLNSLHNSIKSNSKNFHGRKSEIDGWKEEAEFRDSTGNHLSYRCETVLTRSEILGEKH